MSGSPRGPRRGPAAAPKAALISLGCAKNLVDSEIMLGVLRKAGYALTGRAAEADVIVINTCGFIRPAREESEGAIRSAMRLKRRDPRRRVVVAGCYVERDGERLRAAFPAVDAWTGVRSFERIADIVEGKHVERAGAPVFLCSDRSPRLVTTSPTWAYVKISEGCSRRCAFCSIPSIKGTYRSRSAGSVVREVESLIGQGIREIDIVSHETTAFGRDRGIRDGLAKLLERLVSIKGLRWVRVLYGHPAGLTDRLLEVMAEPKVCRYLDLPFQHADRQLLKAMRRGPDGPAALRLLERIRAKLPGVAIRTSLIVGFPGEGRREFAVLREFVQRARFDHLGVFSYSREERTPAWGLGDPVPESEKERRAEEIMALQADISREKNRCYLGRDVECLVEGPDDGRHGRFRGRGRFQAPEVDGLIRFAVPAGAEKRLRPIVRVRITSAGAYDLQGSLCP